MPEHHKNTYDAVIIGAGIGGLVCGCYLAKAGMKMLITSLSRDYKIEVIHFPLGERAPFKIKTFQRRLGFAYYS